MLRNGIFFFFYVWMLTSCVSVSLGPNKAGRASNVKYSAPAVPFGRMTDSNADIAWQSSKTSNTISYFSECPQSDSALESIADEFHSILTGAKVTDRKSNFFNGREAVWTQTIGKLDGIDMKISSVVFRRNGCSYLVSYVARKDRFDEEESTFTKFVEGFRAP